MNMQQIMAQAKRMQGDIERITKEIEATDYQYKNSNILIEASGNYILNKIEVLDENILKDKEMLEDILFVGINDVLKQIKEDKENKLGKYTGGLGGLL